MDIRYSKLPDTSIGSQNFPSSKVELSLEHESTMKRSWFAYISNATALAVHSIFSLVIALMILLYLNNRHFNVSERYAQVHTIRGNETLPFNPTQSDIVTTLSSMIVIQKLALSIWFTPLCWHIAVFLMENRGIRYQDLTTLISYHVLTPSLHLRNFSTFLIGTLLLASIVANLASPVLTGAIAWVPDNQLAHGLATEPILFEDIDESTISKGTSTYWGFPATRQLAALAAVGLAGIGWGQDLERGTLKRVSKTFFGLALNSRIENITLPYFQVHSVRWIQSVESIPINGNYSNVHEKVRTIGRNSSPIGLPASTLGSIYLVPNTSTSWEDDSLERTVTHDTRLLMLYYGIGGYNVTNLPPDTYVFYNDIYKYAFAWVTFSAGVGRCKEYQCVISSPSTIRNNTPMAIEPEPHALTHQALSMMIPVGIFQVTANTSLPLITNIDDYVEATLVRAYSGAWESLSVYLDNANNNASYIPAFPALLARVAPARVYAWLGAQLFVTCLGVLFIVVQFRLSKYPFINENDALIAFHLDTSTIPASGDAKELKEGRILKVEGHGDRLKVKVE